MSQIIFKIGKGRTFWFPDIMGQRNAWRDAAIESAREVARLRKELIAANCRHHWWRRDALRARHGRAQAQAILREAGL